MNSKRERSTSDVPATETSSSDETAEPDFLALLAAPASAPRWPAEPTFVATCTDARHPTLLGRVRVRWGDEQGEGSAQERWLPTLHGLSIRASDRLLVSRVGGLSEPVVVGVIDGFLPRPETSQTPAATLELKPDEVLAVVDASGRELVHLRREGEVAVLRLLGEDTRIDLDGRLSITAAELRLQARDGDVQIEASDRVTVSGETVHLN